MEISLARRKRFVAQPDNWFKGRTDGRTNKGRRERERETDLYINKEIERERERGLDR